MPRALLLLVALLAVAAVVWLVWPTSTDGPAPGGDVLDRPETPAEGPAPTILRGGEGASTLPVEHRGRGMLLGRVLQGGEGRAADVSVHLLERFSGVDPLGMWRGRSFLERILDGGVANGRALATTRSGADGAFTIDGLASGAWELRAVADDGSRARITVSIPAEGARVEARLELPQGGETLRGRVVYEDGRAFEGFVTVSSGQDQEAVFFTGAGAVVASIDREGRFVVGGLAPGPVIVSAVAPGRMRAIGAPVTLPHAEEYVLTLGKGARTYTGRVLDDADSTPLEGASVTAGSGGPGIGFLLTRVFTDAEGRFEVAVPEGNGGMFVEAEGYAPHTGQLEGTDEVEIRLLRMARVTGRVLTKGEQAGAEGVWVFAMPLERGFSLAFPAAVRTGASGRFEMPGIVPGAVTIFAMGGGWTSPGLADVDPEGFNPLAQTLAPGESKEIELEVEPAGRLEGRVTRGDGGRGVAGAVLALKSSFFAFRLTAQTALFGGGVGTTVADDDGRFAVDTLIPGVTYRVEATAVGSPPYVSDELSVASGATERLGIVLEAPRWLVLAVTSSDGTPLPGATVFAGVAQEGTDEHQRVSGEWHTDATGRARVGPLPPGPISIQVRAGEHLAIEDWQPVAGGATTGDLADTVVLEKGLAVGGRVVVPEGASAARVSITVRSRSPGRGRWVWEHTAPDAEGAWRVGGLPDGSYEVEAELVWQDERYEAKATVAAGDAGFDLELVATGSREGTGLVVRILGPDGEPVPGGNVSLITRSRNSSGTHSQSFSNGKATFEVDPDEDEVWVQARARAGSGLGDALLGPIPERSGEVVLRLPRARSIEGRVVTSEGEGVGGVRVETSLPSPLGNRHGGRGDHFALTDEDGRFALRDLGEGPYEIHVKAPPQYGPVPPQAVASGSKNVRFELQAAAAGDVTVLDYEGRPVSGARVTAGISDETAKREDIERHSRSFTTDGEGVAHVRGLATGVPYDVSVAPPEGRDDLRATALGAWTPEALTVRLERAYVIQGVVHDLTGKPVAEARVEYGGEDDPGHWSGTVSAEDGTFRLTGLVRGRYRVRAQVGAGSMPVPRAPGAEEEGWVVVEAGTRGLVLKVDPGATLRIRIQPWTGNEWGQGIALREQRPGGGSYSQGDVDGDGVAVFRGCSPEKRYDVFVGGLPDGQYVLGRDLQATGKEIVLAPQTGGTIRGRLLGASGADVRNPNAYVRILGFSQGGTVREDGTFEIEGVPPGTWPVAGHARRGDDWLTGEAQAAPGGTVEIELAPR